MPCGPLPAYGFVPFAIGALHWKSPLVVPVGQVIVNGNPSCEVTIHCVLHPPTNASATPDMFLPKSLPLPNGNCQMPLA